MTVATMLYKQCAAACLCSCIVRCMQGMLQHTLLKEASYLEGMHATAFNRICNQVSQLPAQTAGGAPVVAGFLPLTCSQDIGTKLGRPHALHLASYSCGP